MSRKIFPSIENLDQVAESTSSIPLLETADSIRPLLLQGLARTGNPSAHIVAERFNPDRPTLAKIAGRMGITRQSVHARSRREIPNAIAGLICVGCESGEQDQFDLLFSRKFQGAFEPLRPSVFRAFDRATDASPLAHSAWTQGWEYGAKKLTQLVKCGITDDEDVASAIMCHVLIHLLTRRAPKELHVAVTDTFHELKKIGFAKAPFAHRLFALGLAFCGQPDELINLLRNESAFDSEYLGFMMFSVSERSRRKSSGTRLPPSFGERVVKSQLDLSAAQEHFRAAGLTTQDAIENALVAAKYPVTNALYHGGPLTPALACWITGPLRHLSTNPHDVPGLQNARSQLSKVIAQNERRLCLGMSTKQWQALNGLLLKT